MTDKLELSSSLEDYLEVIAELSFDGGTAHCIDIARKLHVKKPSVTAALRALAEKGLILYRPYMPISLTKRGRSTASKIIRRHNALKTFFTKVLGISSGKADEAACKIEHAIGDKITDRFVDFVDFLEVCPRAGLNWIHGHAYSCPVHGQDKKSCQACIEQCFENLSHTSYGREPVMKKTLDKLKAGEKGQILEVSNSMPSRKKFADLGIVKGVLVKVEKTAPLGDPILVRIKGHNLSFRKGEAANITVKILNK